MFGVEDILLICYLELFGRALQDALTVGEAPLRQRVRERV